MIESIRNQRVKDWRKLHTPKGRSKQNSYLVEGHHLVQEALKAGVDVKLILLTPQAQSQATYLEPGQNLQLISPQVADYLAQTESSQGIFAIVRKTHSTEEYGFEYANYLLLDGVQDPGNVGTLIRTAAAAGYRGVVLGEGTADPYNDKVIRASQGSIWQIGLIEAPLDESIELVKRVGVPVFASALDKSAQTYHILEDYPVRAIIVGNEGQGVRPEIIDQADHTIYIPMPGLSESLNVAVAAGIMIFR